MNRRTILTLGLVGSATAIPFIGGTSNMAHATKKKLQLDPNPEQIEPFALDKVEWKMRLNDEAFYVMREEGTERPFTSELNDEKRLGTFACTGCKLSLFNSDKKYDSGTGWPSFWEPIEGHIETKTDFKMFLPRTEYHCARCGGHQGHVFKDGPKPTGLRYCNNGVALTFVPQEALKV